MVVPNGHVIVGMQTYIDPAPGGGVAPGNSAGVAWRYAPVTSCEIPNMAAVIGQQEAMTSNRNDVFVFPNPSSGVLEVGVSDFIGSSVVVVITNLMGQKSVVPSQLISLKQQN